MAVSNPQGFLLLTLPNATLTAPQYPQQRGTLSLECVTLQVPSPMDSTSPERDVWLVLRLGSFEMPIPATQAILHSRAANSYTFPTQQGPVILSLAPASNPSMAEDLETVEVILAQYGVLQHTDASTSPGGSDSDIKGRLVLVDDNNGAIVGSLADDFTLREDPNMFTEGREKDPVIIEIPDEGHQMYVQPIPFEEHGAMMKTAGLLSRGIIYATGAIASGMQTASDYYVRSATPNKEPMVFSETTRTNVKRVHKFSGQAVKVTAKTTGLIHDAVASFADRLGGKSNAQAPPGPVPGPSGYMTPPAYPGYAPDQKLAPPGAAYRGPSPPPGGPPPPLPPRKKPRLLNRLLLSTDLLLTTVEKSAYTLVTQASTSASQTLGHKYGQDMGNAAAMVGETVKNVHVVYVDARGVGRRALLKSATKRIVKGRMGSKEVRLTADDWHAQTEREVQESTKDGYLNFSGYFGRGKTM